MLLARLILIRSDTIKKFLIGIISLILILTGCMYEPQVNGLKYFTGSFMSMNTYISVSLFANDKTEADRHFNQVKKIFDKFDKCSDAQLDKFVDVYYGNPYSKDKIFENISAQDTSELAKLNYYRELNNASPELVELLKFSIDMQEETNGYFNPCLGYLNSRWKAVISGVRDPRLNNEGENIYYSRIAQNAKIEIDGRNIKLTTERPTDESYSKGYLVDLGGIAKGYATEKANQYLKTNCKYYLLNAGSSNIACGEFMDNEKDYWKVGISYPFGYPNKNPDIKVIDGYYYVDGFFTNAKDTGGKIYYGVDVDYLEEDIKAKLEVNDVYFSLKGGQLYKIEKITENNNKRYFLTSELGNSVTAITYELKNKSIVTSSPEQQHIYIDGKMYHHILNPFTGAPTDLNVSGKESVSIIGNHGGKLDAYSTALFVMPLEEAKEFVVKKKINATFIVGNQVIEVNGTDV